MDITPKGFERASDKLTAEQLDRPVDEVVAPKETEKTPEAVVVAPTESVPETPIETESEPEKEEEEKVPKSRFLTVSKRAIDAERALRQFQAEQETRPEPTPISDDADLKKFYTETFGDTELAEKLYKNELARLSSIEEKAAERAYERLSQREQVEAQIIDQRVESFDHAFEELALESGKDSFTDEEQVAMLDIVEEYSPKDRDGKLLGEYLLPLDKAYEIYQLQQEPVEKPKNTQRNAVAALTGARSEGTPSGSNDAEWQPGQDRRWWNKVK